MHAPEIELKFSVPDVHAFRARVAELGLALVTERTFEANTLYDTPERSLRVQKQLLRLRLYGSRCVVTHKRVPDGQESEGKFKTRIETESEVQDCAALAEIFSQLGYDAVFRYEKYRTEWDFEGGHLVLDETPIGVWAELEGPEQWIETMLERLEVAPNRCTTESYGMMFLKWKETEASPAENLTFDEISPALAV